MGPTEREDLISVKRLELIGDFDAHLQAVEDLVTKHNLDLDVMTDITPDLLDVTKPESRETLSFYQKLYTAIDDKERYIVISRYSTGLADGCYGFGQEAKYEINGVWLRTFKNLNPDKIKYIKGDGVDSFSSVQIDGPSALSTIGEFRELPPNEPVTLFSAEPYRTSLWSKVTPELRCGLPAISSGNEAYTLLGAASDNIRTPSLRMGGSTFSLHSDGYHDWYSRNLEEDYPKEKRAKAKRV